MRLLVVQHEEEGPGEIAAWAAGRGLGISRAHFDRGEPAPSLEGVGLVAVMGGSMNVYQYRLHPWLRAEKGFLESVLREGVPVLGVCLGAQLLADLLGAKVYQADAVEVGWHPVRFLARDSADVPPGLPDEATVLHWHGDTFDLPGGATRFAETGVCPNQAFAWGDKVVGLQFHLEAGAAELPAFASDYPKQPGPWIQSKEEILAGAGHAAATRPILDRILDHLLPSSRR